MRTTCAGPCKTLTNLDDRTGIYRCGNCKSLWILPPAYQVINTREILEAAYKLEQRESDEKVGL